MKETKLELLFINQFNEILGVLSSDVLLFVFTALIMRPGTTHYIQQIKRTTKVNLRIKDTKKIHLSKHFMKSAMFCVKIFRRAIVCF